MSNFGTYTGREFFALELEKRKFLLQGLLKEKDTVMIVGDEKAGKSLFSFQMICSLVSGHPFLDRFPVKRTARVHFIQLEGQLEDSQERFNLMRHSIDFDESNFSISFERPLSLDDVEEITPVIEMVNQGCKGEKPDVIFFDPVYFALEGDLSDNQDSRKFLRSVRIIKEHFGCAIVWVHHTHKIKTDQRGNILDEGDEAAFGSKFFKAYPDHVLYLKHNRQTGLRTLICETQRGGDIVRSLELELVQPDPLYFRETEVIPTKEVVILNKLPMTEREGFQIGDITRATGLAESTCYATLRNLTHTGQVKKTRTRPVRYFRIT